MKTTGAKFATVHVVDDVLVPQRVIVGSRFQLSCLVSTRKFLLTALFAWSMCGLTLAEDNCCGFSSPGNPYLCYEKGNCTWWAWNMRRDLPGWSGDAKVWLSSANSAGIPTGTTPRIGSIACFPDMAEGLGHVAYVEVVHADGSFDVSEMGYHTWDCLHHNTYPAESAAGFIYGGPVETQSCQWQSQSPSGSVNLFPGQLVSFSVSYTNTGTTSWQNTTGPDYVELRSCDLSGNVTNSWLYPGANQGWIDAQRVVTSSTSNIGNGQIATFSFKGKVPMSATPGQYKIYFRPYHSTGGLIENWGGMHFQINVVTGWLASTPKNDCVGPIDAQGHRWSEPEFNAGAWSPVSIPDGNWSCSGCDRYYRRFYDYPGTSFGTGVSVWFRTDDGSELFVNGLRVGGWGAGVCHQSGCVNGTNCAINQSVPAVDITTYLHPGINIIGMHVSNGGQGAYFDCVISTPPLVPTASGVCCLGTSCTPIGQSFTTANCLASGGTLFQGKQYDCGTYSPCDKPENKATGDPVLTFQTALPIPTLPAPLAFLLVDTLPHTAWYALPFSLGGDTLYIDGYTGQFTVMAQNSVHPDTVDLKLTSYSFQASSVLLNGFPTGPNQVTLDTSVIVNRHGTYCRSTKHIDMVVPSMVSNTLFPPSNPIKSRSYVIGNFDISTGQLITASASIDVLPECCLAATGNVDCDLSDATDIADLSALIDYLYISFQPLCCVAEANTDGAGGIDIADLSALIDFMYISFTPTAPCQ